MSIEKIQQKINSFLDDAVISAKEASEIRDDLLLSSDSDIQKLKDSIDIKELTPDAKTIINDLYANKDAFAFSPEQRKLVKSISFQRVFPNFFSLTTDEQKTILAGLDPFLKKFPNMIDKLASASNPSYGKGFQFFFVNSKSTELGKIICKDSESFVGKVMPGAEVVKNPVLNALLSPFGNSEKLQVGGMFIDVYNQYELFTHEFSHALHLHMLNDDQRDKIASLYDHAKLNNCFITGYSATNPYEYFAESFSSFLGPGNAALAMKDPEMYKFIRGIFESEPQYGEDGNLINDPEKASYTFYHKGDSNLHGATIGRESSLVTIEHFQGSVVTDISLLGNDNSFVVAGSAGIKAAWKPWNKPVDFYGTVGGTANAGIAGGKATAGIGAFVGAGIDLYNFNAEVRQNFNTNAGGTEIRAGYRFEF